MSAPKGNIEGKKLLELLIRVFFYTSGEHRINKQKLNVNKISHLVLVTLDKYHKFISWYEFSYSFCPPGFFDFVSRWGSIALLFSLRLLNCVFKSYRGAGIEASQNLSNQRDHCSVWECGNDRRRPEGTKRKKEFAKLFGLALESSFTKITPKGGKFLKKLWCCVGRRSTTR